MPAISELFGAARPENPPALLFDAVPGYPRGYRVAWGLTNTGPDTQDQAALFVGSFSDQYVPPADLMTNSRIAHSAYYGINAMWQAPQASRATRRSLGLTKRMYSGASLFSSVYVRSGLALCG